MPSFVVLGIMGGLLGAIFIKINFNILRFRKKYIKTKARKIIEIVVLVSLTSTIFYFAPLLFDNCLVNEDF
jgi:chloride channel 7